METREIEKETFYKNLTGMETYETEKENIDSYPTVMEIWIRHNEHVENTRDCELDGAECWSNLLERDSEIVREMLLNCGWRSKMRLEEIFSDDEMEN